jgi:hypothetical protein
MEESKNFVSSIIRLWNLHLLREKCYRQAMAADEVAFLRRICSHGYISSLLFKKEIQWIYDENKSALEDGDIERKAVPETLPVAGFLSKDKLSITYQLRKQEKKIIKIYRSLLSDKHLSRDAQRIFKDHLEKLSDIRGNLKKELLKSYANYHPFNTRVS